MRHGATSIATHSQRLTGLACPALAAVRATGDRTALTPSGTDRPGTSPKGRHRPAQMGIIAAGGN
ncbi:hypothetical protein SBBP1_890020 [Burkholderiales bacterium]|nr:hypothetical protein SBBP1_890020 [Burkholderiales bacterium]